MTRRDHGPTSRARGKKCVTVAEVSTYPLVVPNWATRDALDGVFYDHHLKPNWHGTRFQRTAEAFCGSRCRGRIIARSNIEEDIRPRFWLRFKFSDAQSGRDLAIVFRKDKSLSRAAKAFMDIAVKQKNFSAAGAGKHPNDQGAVSSSLYFVSVTRS